MIIDKIENIGNYPQIPEYIVNFIKGLSEDTECMRYELIDEDFVNVETYTTKLISDAKFETHNNYVDIQLLLDGEERIYLTSREGLNESAPYNPEKDITFYTNSIEQADFVTLDGSNFVLIYPHEAHAPQVSLSNKSMPVKKAVAKVRI
ncbi:YhcH/YjgK/YiaL family protein [bacterium]|nr:YhcH/YjgK/YiaL family protein [bacterium]